MGKKPKGIWFEREVYESRAFRELNGTAMRTYILFLSKRQRQKRRHPKKGKHWVTTNNGEIEFTYKEAEKRWGIRQGAFRENRDRLVELGFIDIAQSGAGLYKSKTLYAISERWRKYGTPEFELVERKKDSRHIGYQQRHKKR